MVSDSLLTGRDSYFKGHLFNVGVINSNALKLSMKVMKQSDMSCVTVGFSEKYKTIII